MSQKVQETLSGILLICGSIISLLGIISTLLSAGDPIPGKENIAYIWWAVDAILMLSGMIMVSLGFYLDNKSKKEAKITQDVCKEDPDAEWLSLAKKLKMVSREMWVYDEEV